MIDTRRIRALSHPLRIELLEALRLHRELTATEAANLVGRTASSASFHLRQLAKYGFVEEAGRRGPGRDRPWRLSHLGVSFSTETSDRAASRAAEALARSARELAFARYQRWLDGQQSVAASWRMAASLSQTALLASPDELREMGEELRDMITRWQARAHSSTSSNRMPVQLLAIAFPVLDEPKGRRATD